MSFKSGITRTAALEIKMNSKSFREGIKTAAGTAKNLLNKVQVMHKVVESYGDIPDNEYENVVNGVPFYAQIQKLAELIPALKETSQILDKMHDASMSFPYPLVRVTGDNDGQGLMPALPVDSIGVANPVDSIGVSQDGLETEDEDENIEPEKEERQEVDFDAEREERLGVYRQSLVMEGHPPSVIKGALDFIRDDMKKRKIPSYAVLGGDGNPGPIPVGMKPAPPAPVLGGGGAGSISVGMKPAPAAPVLGGGGAGLAPKENNCSFLEQMAKLSDQIPIERVKRQARVMPQAPLEASAQVKKEPGLSAAQIAQAATDNAAQQGLSNTINLVDSDDE